MQTRPTPSVFFRTVLAGGCIGTLIILLVTLIDGPPKYRNEYLYQRLSEWVLPGYFATNDLRNYLIGICIFALAPLLSSRSASWRSGNPVGITGLLRLRTRNDSVSRRTIFFLFTILTVLSISALTWFIFLRWELLMHLLATKSRGKQLVESLRMLPFVALVWAGVFVGIWMKILSRLTLLVWKVTRKIQMKKNSIRYTIPSLFVDLFIVLMIILLVWNPRYAYTYERLGSYGSEGNHQFHHVISFIGPINEALHGTGFLVRSGAQYGILATLIPAAIFFFTSLSFSSFIAYVMVVFVIYEILWYGLLLRTTGNRLQSALGTIISIRLIHYRWFWPHEASVYPSSTPLRYGWDVIVWLAIVLVAAHPSRWRIHVLAAAVATAVWYNVEIGMALALSTFGAFIWERKWRVFMHYLKMFAAVFAGWGIVLSLLTWVRAGALPQWGRIFTSVGLFGRGFLDIPMPIIGPYYILLSVYYVAYCYLVIIAPRRPKDKHPDSVGTPPSILTRDDDSYLFIAKFTLLYGLVSFVYYLGFNEPHHLLTVMHPALLLSILALSRWRAIGRWIGQLGLAERSLAVTYFLIVGAFLLWEPAQFFTDVARRVNDRYGPLPRVYHHWSYPGAGIYITDNDGKDVQLAAEKIRRFSGDSSKALVLSRYDTLLYVMAGKTSWADMSYLEYEAVFKDQQWHIIDSIRRSPPEYAFVYSKRYRQMRTDTISMVWEAIAPQYGFIEHAGIIDVYRLVGSPLRP